MWKHPGAKRLTWDPSLQFPFESGWSLFQKIKILNNLKDYELVDLIAREPVPLRKGRLRDCADSSWIDFDRFSELLEVPAAELKNGFWDQLGIRVIRPKEYELRLCKMCWEMHRYHCVLFDLMWVRQCPWHNWPVDLPKATVVSRTDGVLRRVEPPAVSFDELRALTPMASGNKHRMIGHILEYLEWWRGVQTRVPQADRLLRRLVSTCHMTDQNEVDLRWQAGFAQSRMPLRYGSWILEDVKSRSCCYARVTDSGRSKTAIDDRNTVRDHTGLCYRSIRRHVFRRYVRRHRACLTRLAQLSRDDLLSLAADGICATCLAYVVWRMSVENLVVVEGLFTRRSTNYALRLTEPSPESPSDDPARLRFTYMQFFGIWAAIVDHTAREGLRVSMQDTVSSPQFVFAWDQTRPANSPLAAFDCIYPEGDVLARNAGRPCKAPWALLPYEQQCAIRSQKWLDSLTPRPKSVLELYLESGPGAVEKLRQIWV
jgi:hypothetical protein